MRARVLSSLIGCAALLLGALLLAASTARAQTRRAAIAFDLSGGDAASLAIALDPVLREAGFAVAEAGSVRAARSFGGYDGVLDAEGSVGLRSALSVDLLVVVRTMPAGDDATLNVVVLRVTEQSMLPSFEQAAMERLGEIVAGLLRRGLAVPIPGAPAAIESPAPAVPAQPIEGSRADPSIEAPPVVAPTPVLVPGQTAPVAPPPPVAPQPFAAQPPLPQQPLAAQPLFAQEPVARQPPPTAQVAIEPATAVAATPPEIELEETPPPAEAMRLRFAIDGFAGFDVVGYGLGLRIEIPLVRVLPRDDNALVLGLQAGVGLDGSAPDERHDFLDIHVPLAAHLTWWIAVGDAFEIGPRVGVAAVIRDRELSGQLKTGTFITLAPFALVGAQAMMRLDGGLGLQIGVDLALGVRVAPVISLGLVFR